MWCERQTDTSGDSRFVSLLHTTECVRCSSLLLLIVGCDFFFFGFVLVLFCLVLVMPPAFFASPCYRLLYLSSLCVQPRVSLHHQIYHHQSFFVFLFVCFSNHSFSPLSSLHHAVSSVLHGPARVCGHCFRSFSCTCWFVHQQPHFLLPFVLGVPLMRRECSTALPKGAKLVAWVLSRL